MEYIFTETRVTNGIRQAYGYLRVSLITFILRSLLRNNLIAVGQWIALENTTLIITFIGYVSDEN